MIEIARVDQLHRWIQTKAVFSQTLIPNQKSWNDCRARPQGEQGDRRCCRSGNSEELGKNTLAAGSVLVEQNSDSFVLPERLQDVARRTSSFDRNVATPSAIRRNQSFNARIIDRSNHKSQRIPVNCMSKGTQFPSPKVGRHENNASPTTQTFKIIFESIMNDEPADVAFVQFRHVRELHE